MGYDCTLHVIDEALIREHFVPRLLGQSEERRVFDEREDADTLWARVREALAREGEYGKSAASTASLISQLAVAYCASELPNHYERGLCLSLWPDQPDGLHGKVPKKLVGDPAALFEAVIAARPDLKGRFPKEITGNWSTGLYIPAENVPELLAFVEKKVKRYPKPDRRLFRGLILILRYAAERGLGYWEGTDLPVKGGEMRPPECERRVDVEECKGPEGLYMECKGEAGSLLALSSVVGWPEKCRTGVADLNAWPPTFAFVEERTICAAQSRRGRWVSVSVTLDQPKPNRARTADSPTGARTALLPDDEREYGVDWAEFVGERVVATLLPQGIPPLYASHVPAVLLLEEAGKLVPIEGLPPAQGDERSYGAAHLNDGTDVFLWAGDGYEWRDGRFEATFELGAQLMGEPTVAWGPDGFLYLHHERVTPSKYIQTLRSARRGQAPTRHLPKHDLVMRISPGPEGAVLVKLGHNRQGDLGLVYFPEDGTYIRLEEELLPDEDPDDVDTLHWAPGCGRLIALTDKRFWAVPIETVMALPRVKATTGRQVAS
jgi:hypothetical protein